MILKDDLNKSGHDNERVKKPHQHYQSVEAFCIGMDKLAKNETGNILRVGYFSEYALQACLPDEDLKMIRNPASLNDELEELEMSKRLQAVIIKQSRELECLVVDFQRKQDLKRNPSCENKARPPLRILNPSQLCSAPGFEHGNTNQSKYRDIDKEVKVVSKEEALQHIFKTNPQQKPPSNQQQKAKIQSKRTSSKQTIEELRFANKEQEEPKSKTFKSAFKTVARSDPLAFDSLKASDSSI